MPQVPTPPGPQVLPTGAGRVRVRAPDVAIPGVQLPQVAPLQQHEATLPLQQQSLLTTDLATPDYAGAGGVSLERAQRQLTMAGRQGDLAAQGARNSLATTGQFAQGLGQAGDAIAQITLDVQRQANALVTDNAVNKAKETALRLAYDKSQGFTSLRGYDALNRPDGKPLADEYGAKFDEAVKVLAGDLKNHEQREAFAAQALQIRTGLVAQAIQHETAQFREYNLSTQEGTIKTEMNNIGLNYKNPDQVNSSVERLKGAVAEQGLALGKSVQWIEATQRDVVSKAHSTALAAALTEDNVVYADAYMRHYGKDMNADDMLRVRGVITKEMDGRMGLSAAKDAVDSVGKSMSAEPGAMDYERFNTITMGAESGGREFAADGSRLTSPKGARGAMQVMPATADKPGYGIKKSDGTPADDARLAREYGAAMIKKYDGDVALAWAAYNAGPGTVDKAIKDAAADPAKSWFDLVPKETQAYVKGNLQAWGSGAGAPSTPTLNDVLAKIDADPRVNSSPERLRIARTEATARYSALKADMVSRKEEITAEALKGVEANGGNYLALPVQLRAAIPADKRDTVMNFADKVRGGNTVTNLALYQRLTDEKYLSGLNDNQFFALRPELSPSDFQHFADQREKLAKGLPGNGPGDLNTPAIGMVVNNRLQSLGIDPTPKDTDKDAMARVGSINRFVRESVAVAQAQHGKKFTDVETETFIDQLFAKNLTFRNTVFGVGGTNTQRMLEMTVKDIPSSDLKSLRDAFTKRGMKTPSDADLLQAYWRAHTLAGR
jgi:soluble lytic murein transglycosylase